LLRKPDQVTRRFSVTMFGPGNGSLRTDRWRFIRYSDGSEELYDLMADPHEWENLVGKSGHRKLLLDLRSKMTPYIVDAEQ
ncbi:MAG: sulfatase/phosphatase domain-containing protein, partial [Rubripirellula sp.]